jgi:signal transduction histidine kinase
MTPASRRYDLPSRRGSLVVLAVVLPLIASALSAWVTVFHRTPYALGVLVVAVIAGLADPLTSLIAAFFSVFGRFVFSPMFGDPVSLNKVELIRIAVVLGAAMIISVMTLSRRKAQAALEEAHTELQDRTDALIESLRSSKCASWTMRAGDSRGPIWFSGSYPIFGRPFNHIDRLDSFLAGVHPEDRHQMAAILGQMKSSSVPILCEYRAFWPDGDLHWFEMRATRVPGAAALWRGLTMDITERKFTETALVRTEKLAAMGRLASTVAHEINNPLEAVTNLLYLAQSDSTLSADTRSFLATAETELARLGDITRLTLGFVRGSSRRRSVDIALIVDEVLSIFRHRLVSKGIHVERNYHPDILIEIAPHELRQILTNLISNASDAVDGAESRIAIQVKRNGDGRVHVVVEDNGDGIAPDALPRIFEPFFTTKEDIGTGIGLWVTRELVESNGGNIVAESGALNDGVKTRFTIDFPTAV